MQAVAEFWVYAIVFLIIAFALCLRAMVQAIEIIVKKMLGPFGFVGDVLGGAFGSVASAITTALDAVIHDLEHFVGWSLHVQAQLIRWLADYLAYGASVVLHLGQHVSGKAGLSDLTLLHKWILRQIKAVAHAGSVALHETVVINKKGDALITRNVLPRLKALEHETARVLEPELDGLRHADRTLTRDLTALERYVRAHPWTAVTDAFVGAVAIAIGRLGLDWIRCASAKSIFGRRGCGLWSGIDDLLSLLIDAALITNICAVIGPLESVFNSIAAPLIGTLAAVGAGQCEGTAGPPETLPPPGIVKPPLQALNVGLP